MQNIKKGIKVIVWPMLACVLLGTAYFLQAQDVKSSAVIRGSVRTPDVTSLYGIMVKARGEGKNYSTYVFTDEKGNYDFPPLPLGAYRVSVGNARRETVRLSAAGATQDFSVELGPDLLDQTTGANYLKLIPGSEAEKSRIAQDCVSCHSTTRLFTRPPLSPQGWGRIVDTMISSYLMSDGRGALTDWWPTHPDSPVNDFYKARFSKENMKALTDFLAKNMTPETRDEYAAKAMVRPTGEASRVVFTEWD